ncbi:MAG: undecaprenyl-diphosphate phosphatase [Erysipelothrix sp.]|nr:undecaprenyl-diphosphate phosphatase [Erysipelothrix sp.]
MNFFEILKIIFIGIVEGITEWLPISSTGHMLLVDEFIKLNGSDAFKEVFFVVIQLGAILAVLLLFWNKMLPIKKVDNKWTIKQDTVNLWLKVIVALIPGTVVTLLFDDYVSTHFETPTVIALALIFYGIIFIIIENRNKDKEPSTKNLMDITYKTAFIIGVFQILSIVPGTSRSGATIIGGLLIGVSRFAVAEFTFFLAVPVMFGLSFLKLLNFGFVFTGVELFTLLLGSFVAFVVSIFVIKFLMDYIKKNDFKVFGWYRIALGILVLAFFML